MNRPRARPLGFGGVDPERSPTELVAVEALDGGQRRCLLDEVDEGEAARAAGLAVGREEYLPDFADFGKELVDLVLLRAKVQVADEYLGTDDILLLGRPLSARQMGP